jgi:hypothetical protein
MQEEDNMLTFGFEQFIKKKLLHCQYLKQRKNSPNIKPYMIGQ